MTSCIKHPHNSYYVKVHDWQIVLCEGNTTAAALLSFFERWHNHKLAMLPKNIQSNNIAATHGDPRSQDESTLQFHSEQELIDGIQSIGKRDSVRKSINWLESKGFISIHSNPNKRYAFDKTRYFQFHPELVNEWLEMGMSENRPPMSKKRSRSSEKQSRSSENQPPSSENTSAITDHASDNPSDHAPKEKDSPTPQPEITLNPEKGSDRTLFAEIVKPENQETKTPSPDTSIIPESSKLVPKEKNAPGDDNDSRFQSAEKIPHPQTSGGKLAKSKQTTAARVKENWEKTGCLPKIPMEYEAWAQEGIGSEIIALYRHSGRITTTGKNDIRKEVALYVAQQWQGKDIDYGYQRIRNLEDNPKDWPILVALVLKYQASSQTGDRNINIAREVERASKPLIELDFNNFKP